MTKGYIMPDHRIPQTFQAAFATSAGGAIAGFAPQVAPDCARPSVQTTEDGPKRDSDV